MKGCKVTYIERYYRKESPKLADKLTDIYHDIWNEITGSNLFTRKYGEGPNATYLFSARGTEQNKKQNALIDKINKMFGAPNGKSVIKLEPTKSGMNAKVSVDVHPIAKTELNKLNPQQALFQKKGKLESSKANTKTIAMVKDFLKRIGVSIDEMDKIVVNGIVQDSNAAALITQKLIQVTRGMTDVALTEEAMHFAVEIIKQKNPTLYKQLLKEINNYSIYKEVLAEYGNDPLYIGKDGKPNIQKLKDEAIGKVLAETIIGSVEGRTEKPELLARVETWWEQILRYLNELFNESGFDEAAMKVVSGEAIGTAEDIRAEEGEVFLQTVGNTQNKIFDGLRALKNTVIKKDDGYYVNGKKVPRRVSDLVSGWYERRFKNKELTKSEYQRAIDDLKMEKGTAGHLDLEHAFSLFVDENGYLRSEPLNDSDYVSRLDPYNRDYYEILRDNLKARLNLFESGTRFLAEAVLYDAKRGLAGTADFIAVEPSGKTHILDWKFMDLNVEKWKDVPWYKVNAWRQQMEQYQLLIKTQFGLKQSDFGQARMIPIKAYYTPGDVKTGSLPMLDGVEIGDADVANINADYLLPVGIEDETTGDERIDNLLVKLNALYKQLSDAKVLPSQKLDKREQLNTLFSAIRQLQMKNNIKPLLYQAKVLNVQMKNIVKEYNEKWKNADAKAVKIEDINSFSDTILSSEEAIITYASLDADLKFLFPEGKELSKEDKELRDEIRATADNARDLIIELKAVKEGFGNNIIAKREGTDNLLSPEKIVKGFSKWFASTSIIQTKAVQVLFKMANKAFGYAAMETLDETMVLTGLKAAYDKLAKSKGWVTKNYFDIIKKKDSNELIDEYDPEFYKELKKRIQDKDFEWILDNVNRAKYKESLDEKLEEEIQRINDKVRIEVDRELDDILRREIAEAEKLYDVSSTNSVGWLLYDEVRKHPDTKWQSKEWKELTAKGNEAAKDFYDYIIKRNTYYSSIGYINARQARVFLPWVRKGMMERIITGGKSSLGEQFLKNISIDEETTGFGKTNPLTGKLINDVPIYLTSEIEGDVSTDLFRTMALYNEMAIKFKHVTEIEAQARLLISVERNKKAIATSMYGKTEYKEGILQYTPDNNENTELLDKMVKGIIYGQKYLEDEGFDQLLGKFGKFGERANAKLKSIGIDVKIFPESLAGRQISVNKVINQINTTFQLNALGLNVLSATSNLFGGTAQSVINAGTYFTKADYAGTELWVAMHKMGGKDKKKALAALEYFLPLTENYNKEVAKTLSVNKLTQENLQEFLMVLMRNSDLHVQTVNFYSFLKNSIVINGEVINARQYLRAQPEYENKYQGTTANIKAFEDKFEEDVQKLVAEKGVMSLSTVVDGKLVIPGVERKSDSVIELRRKVQSLSKDALGNLSEDDIRLINLNVYGKSFMMFKGWIPRLADVRFGNLKYNAASDAYEWGRMRNTYRIISEDVFGAIGNLYNTFQGNEKGVNFMRELYEKKKADYETDTGKVLEMTETQFLDLVKKNVKGQLLDLIVLLTLVSLYAGIKAYAPDDDEMSKNQHKFLVKGADKLRDELLYFYNPTSIANLVSQGVFPGMGLIKNFGTVFGNFLKENYYILTDQKEEQEKNFVIKYVMTSFPLTNQFKSWLPMFYPDLAKDLGIKTQSQSGIR